MSPALRLFRAEALDRSGVIPGRCQRVRAKRGPMTGSASNLRCAIAHLRSGADAPSRNDQSGLCRLRTRLRETIMSTLSVVMQARPEAKPFYMAVIAGLACAFVIGKALPAMMDTVSTIVAPLCAVGDPTGSALDTVEPPGATHLVSANASNSEPAEPIAVFVADEGAQLTTFIE